ncbi:hypothetical protein EOD23_03535 [Mesorhizobium sp. USDA-HM6]|nr:hypothetical protein EOD23_03535 [Mesorhizobium sp. USDA-HM6]
MTVVGKEFQGSVAVGPPQKRRVDDARETRVKKRSAAYLNALRAFETNAGHRSLSGAGDLAAGQALSDDKR